MNLNCFIPPIIDSTAPSHCFTDKRENEEKEEKEMILKKKNYEQTFFLNHTNIAAVVP